MEGLTFGGIATLACVLEVSAPKPGNVHRGADFEDVTFNDFLISAVVLGQSFDQMLPNGIGTMILESVRRTNHAVGTNTNLGIALLLAPLVQVADSGQALQPESVRSVLEGLGPEDGGLVFEAIRLANPGGLGNAEAMDVKVSENQNVDLLAAMKIAEARDLIARQYCSGFELVFGEGMNHLRTGVALFATLPEAIVYTHLALMRNWPDSLIARKCGSEVATRAAMMAGKALTYLDADASSGERNDEPFWNEVSELDFWLRSDGHRRNPGTTADLIAAILFVALVNKILDPAEFKNG